MIFKIYSSIAYFISRNIFKILLILFFKLRIRGRENLPAKGGFIMASNHVSYMDPPIVGSAAKKRVHFITSDHLYSGKLLALWYKSVGCLKIKREGTNRSVIRKIIDYLKDGEVIGIFPEGTRSEDGSMKEALAGIGFLALKSRTPVVPCFIKGSEKALPRGAKSFTSAKVFIYIGKPIETKEFRYEGDKKEAYRLFSKKVMKAIAQLGKEHGD